MASELQNWLLDREYQIVDYKDGVWNQRRTNDQSISVNYDFETIQNINVFLSEKTSMDTNNDNSIGFETKLKRNINEWFGNPNERLNVLSKFNTLFAESEKVIQLLETLTSNATLSVSQTRFDNALKTLRYATSNAIFNYGFKNFENICKHVIHFNDSQSVLLKFIKIVIPTLLCGANISLISSPNNALAIAYLIDILVRAGIKPGVIDSIIVDFNCEHKIDQTIVQNNPIIVIFESGDVHSAVEKLALFYQTNTLNTINAFVQQSVYKKFCERMKSQLPNLFRIGNKYESTSDLEVEINVNYDAIDVDSDNNFTGINIYQFRSNDEAKLLVNHFVDIPYISLWAEKTSLALEFAQLLTSSHQIFINCGLFYNSIKEIPIYDTVMDSIDVNRLISKQLYESIMQSQTKWNSYDEYKRNGILNDYIVKINSALNTSVITYNKSILEIYENNGMTISLSYRKPIGIIALQIDEQSDKLNDTIIFSDVLKALQMGNAVMIFGTNKSFQLKSLYDYLVSIENGVFKYVLQFVDIKDNFSNSIIKNERKAVGVYYKLSDTSRISNDIFTVFNKSITLQIGDICFAK